MLRLYRTITKGEFFVVFGDCAQGGSDANVVQFMSKERIDIPLVLTMQGVAAGMTPVLHQTLEWLFDRTGIQPVVALERNNGGASEMERLRKLNRNNKYRLYMMRTFGKKRGEKTSEVLGWTTDSASRPRLIGDWKEAFDQRQVTIYDEESIKQHKTFITNKQNRPEAAPNTHDDHVISCGGAWQLYQTETKVLFHEFEEDDDYEPEDFMN